MSSGFSVVLCGEGPNPRAVLCMQVLPRQYTDARTYNMLISVCVRAKDLTQALHAADMLESTGRKLDTILYTNLIGGDHLIYFPNYVDLLRRPVG